MAASIATPLLGCSGSSASKYAVEDLFYIDTPADGSKWSELKGPEGESEDHRTFVLKSDELTCIQVIMLRTTAESDYLRQKALDLFHKQTVDTLTNGGFSVAPHEPPTIAPSAVVAQFDLSVTKGGKQPLLGRYRLVIGRRIFFFRLTGWTSEELDRLERIVDTFQEFSD